MTGGDTDAVVTEGHEGVDTDMGDTGGGHVAGWTRTRGDGRGGTRTRKGGHGHEGLDTDMKGWTWEGGIQGDAGDTEGHGCDRVDTDARGWT